MSIITEVSGSFTDGKKLIGDKDNGYGGPSRLGVPNLYRTEMVYPTKGVSLANTAHSVDQAATEYAEEDLEIFPEQQMQSIIVTVDGDGDKKRTMVVIHPAIPPCLGDTCRPTFDEDYHDWIFGQAKGTSVCRSCRVKKSTSVVLGCEVIKYEQE